MSQDNQSEISNGQPMPSSLQLMKAGLLALVVAAVLLIVAILPAEYGIDPTGAGAAFGLTELNVDTETEAEVEPAATSKGIPTVIAAATPGTWHSDKVSITLEPYEDGVELKALMQQGEQMVFSWQTDGEPVFVDMHGEELEAGEDAFSSYWKEKRQGSAQGVFIAPFAGTHGWYWQNISDEPVTVTVNVSGFYEKLITP